MNKSIKRIAALTKRNLTEILRDPISLLFLLALPLLMEILFYFLFHNQTSQFEIKYLAPGIAVFSLAFTTLFAGLLIALDRSTSFLTRLYVSEAKSFEFILGYTFAMIPVTFAQSVLFFVVGGIIDPSFFSVSLIAGVALCIPVSLFFIGTGILLGSLCNEKSIGGVSSIVIAGQSVLSGMWFPLEGINEGVLTVMKILPFRNATMLIQNVICGNTQNFSDFALPLLIVLGYTLAVFICAIAVFRMKMRRV